MANKVSVNGTSTQLTAAEVNSQVDTSKWFDKDVTISPQAEELLEKYSGIPPSDIFKHVTDLQRRAFDTWPYPCIGTLRFLQLTTSNHPSYPKTLERLKAGQNYLDAGTCFGQDLRKLLLDGAPSSAVMYGIDVEPAFFDLGKQLFRDEGRIEATFLNVDLTKPGRKPELQELEGKLDNIGTQSLFHLFPLEDQKTVARHLTSLTKPGSVIAGRQIGSVSGKAVPGLTEGSEVFAHSAESWRDFWADIGRETGTSWQAEVAEGPVPENISKQPWCKPGTVILTYTLNRLS